jgi:hypothetical protein
MKRGFVGFAGLVTAFAAMVPSAHANLLPLPNPSFFVSAAGTNIAPPGGTQIAGTSQAVQIQTSAPTGDWTATLQTTVYNVGGGMLDFLYQFKTDSSNGGGLPVDLEVSTFGGPVSVGYVNSGFNLSGMSGGSVAPVLLSYNSGTVDFLFGGVGVGDTTDTLVVQTPGTAVQAGFTTLEDGGIATFNSFEPSPEPAGIVLFGTVSLLATFFLRRRFVPKAQ